MSNQSSNEFDTSRSLGHAQDTNGAIWQGGAAGSPGQSRARFLWLDALSGEQLVLEVQGDEEFFAGLEDLGFLRESGEQGDPGKPTCAGGAPQNSASSAEQSKMKTRTSRKSPGTGRGRGPSGNSSRAAPHSFSWNRRRGA